MSRTKSYRERTYGPLRDKTLHSALRRLFVSEFGYENKVLFAEAMIERILETLEALLPPSTVLRPGQVLWLAVAHDGRKHALQSMSDIPQVPVILDWVTPEEVQALAAGEDFQTLRRRRHARLLKQAFAQGGVLSQSDLAALSLRHHSTISQDIAAVQQKEGAHLPYRGPVQDAGPTVSHKAEVARLLEAGHLEPAICRMLSPAHDLRSVERYAQSYKNVLKLLAHGFAPWEIASIFSIGQRVIDAYVELVNEHHPDIVARNPHLRDGLHPSTQGPHDPK